MCWQGSTLKLANLAEKTMCTLDLPIEGSITHVMTASPSSLIINTEGRASRRQLFMVSAHGDTFEVSAIDNAPETSPTSALPTTLSALPRSLGTTHDERHLLSGPEAYVAVVGDLTTKLRADDAVRISGFKHPPGKPGVYREAVGVAHCTPLHTVVTARKVNGDNGESDVVLQVLDTDRQTVRDIDLPRSVVQDDGRHWDGSVTYSTADLVGMFAVEDGLATFDSAGCVRMWEVSPTSLAISVEKWKRMIGAAANPSFEISYSNLGKRKELERFSGLGNEAPKHGKEDPNNDPHVGGNQWAGGTGGRDTAGLGGKGGPYRLDKGHDVHQLSDEEKADVPEHIKEAARKMGQEAYAKKLGEIEMSDHDAGLYSSFATEVTKEIKELKHVLFGLEAKAEERTWLRHQTDGDLDDNKLVESITGEHTVYKRRGVQDPMPGGPQQHPKRVRFVVDVSGSMYRFNGHDQRLQRMLQAMCMVMESFDGVPEEKVVYDVVGHSGETPCLPFVSFEDRPKNEKEYLKVLRNMHAHSQFCLSGDHTIEACRDAIDAMAAREDSDERYVVILSDANLDR